jgi:hypothetical protein
MVLGIKEITDPDRSTFRNSILAVCHFIQTIEFFSQSIVGHLHTSMPVPVFGVAYVAFGPMQVGMNETG